MLQQRGEALFYSWLQRIACDRICHICVFELSYVSYLPISSQFRKVIVTDFRLIGLSGPMQFAAGLKLHNIKLEKLYNWI